MNRALAEKFFPNENPIGKTFDTDPEDASGPIQIVGIAADTSYADLRTIAEPASALNGVRTAIESLDLDLPMTDVRTMKEQVRSTLADERALAQLAGGFGLLALVLASIGIYGMMAYAVVQL